MNETLNNINMNVLGVFILASCATYSTVSSTIGLSKLGKFLGNQFANDLPSGYTNGSQTAQLNIIGAEHRVNEK